MSIKKLKKIVHHPVFQWGLIILLITYQFARVVIFVNTYGGIEHDSGWFLGLARSWAETGHYTTMVSTIANPAPGGHQNIYGQYNVQDAEGRVYFFTESGTFVAGILPNAIIIKLFGAGFWQYRAGPLLFLLIALLLASYLLYQFGGLLPVFISQLFFFFYPHLIIFLGYEAMGEIFSLAYILLAFILFISAVRSQKFRLLWFLGCGLTVGLALATKPIALLSLAGLFPAWLILYWRKRSRFIEGASIVVGGVIIPVLWEMYQLLSLTLLFNLQTYQRHLAQRMDYFFNEGGSGLGEQGAYSLDFFLYKLFMVKEISFANNVISLVVLVGILLGGLWLIFIYFQDEFRRNLLILLWGGWFIHSFWFIAISKNGWMRHDWYALILAVFLLSLLTAHFWQQVQHPIKWPQLVLPTLLTGVLLLGFAGQAEAATPFISPQLIQRWHAKHLAADYTRIPWILIPRQAQQEAVNFISQLPSTAKIFYPEGHKSAEMAVLTGRILYPLQRHPLTDSTENDVLLIGPSLISPWTKLMERPMTLNEQQGIINGVIARIKQECPRILFENDYYIICALN